MLLRARILIWVNRRAICPGCHSGFPTFAGVNPRSGLHTEGHIALQYGEGTVKFRKVQIKPL
jgi:hypothetical protein